MSTRPTPEQVADRRPTALELQSIRAYAGAWLERGPVLSYDESATLRGLLAATEPPTDEELASEARIVMAASHTKEVGAGPGSPSFTEIYSMGARREGRCA